MTENAVRDEFKLSAVSDATLTNPGQQSGERLLNRITCIIDIAQTPEGDELETGGDVAELRFEIERRIERARHARKYDLPRGWTIWAEPKNTQLSRFCAGADNRTCADPRS